MLDITPIYIDEISNAEWTWITRRELYSLKGFLCRTLMHPEHIGSVLCCRNKGHVGPHLALGQGRLIAIWDWN